MGNGKWETNEMGFFQINKRARLRNGILRLCQKNS